MDPNSNNPNDPNNPTVTPNGFSWPSTPGEGLNQNPNPAPGQNNNNPATSALPPQPFFPPAPPTLPDPIPANISTNPPVPSAPTEPVQPLNPEPIQAQPDLGSNMTSPSDPISLGDPNLLAATPVEQTPQPPLNQAPPAEQALSEQASAAIGITTQTGGGAEMPPILTETAPTDLSHLIGDTNHNGTDQQNDVYTPPMSQPENLVMPSSATAAPESISTANHQFNLSRLLIIAGVVLVLIVSGLSAYFILGVGRSAPQPASVPAQAESSLTNPPKPIATPTIQPAPATSSAGFGSLQATPTSKANSAVDLIRQRQQSTPSPTLPPVPR